MSHIMILKELIDYNIIHFKRTNKDEIRNRNAVPSRIAVDATMRRSPKRAESEIESNPGWNPYRVHPHGVGVQAGSERRSQTIVKQRSCAAYSFLRKGYIRPNRVSNIPDALGIRDQATAASRLADETLHAPLTRCSKWIDRQKTWMASGSGAQTRSVITQAPEVIRAWRLSYIIPEFLRAPSRTDLLLSCILRIAASRYRHTNFQPRCRKLL